MQPSRRPSFLYARLNVPTGRGRIAMDKIEHIELLKQKTREYLQTYSAKTSINQLASILCKPPTSSLKSVKSMTESYGGSLELGSQARFFGIYIDPAGVDRISPGLAILGAKKKWLQSTCPCEPV